MRKPGSLLIFLIILHLAGGAQTVKIAELYIPTAPGFVLADKSPASIEKPSNPTAFGIALLTLRDGGAIQFTPYWLFNHTSYSFNDYVKQKIPFLQTLNFSIATYKTDTTGVISAGLKTQVLRIYSSGTQTRFESLKQQLVELLSAENLDKERLEEIEKLRKKINGLKASPVVNLEMAAALNSASASFSFKDLQTERTGIWANLRFSLEKFPLDLTGLIRYSWTKNREDRFLDYGIALSYQQPVFDLSLEYVSRNMLTHDTHTDRLSFVVNYMITDEIIIVGSLGKNFNKVGNLLTLFGVKFGISTEKMKL